jgi:hypothetical protein
MICSMVVCCQPLVLAGRRIFSYWCPQIIALGRSRRSANLECFLSSQPGLGAVDLPILPLSQLLILNCLEPIQQAEGELVGEGRTQPA